LQEQGTGIGDEFSAIEVGDDGLDLGGCKGGGVVIHCVLVVVGKNMSQTVSMQHVIATTIFGVRTPGE